MTASLTISELGARLRAGAITAEQLTSQALGRIASHDAEIHAFIRLEVDAALAAARVVDDEMRRGVDRGPLHGVPYAIKDIYDVEGLPTTCHSKLRLDHRAAADSAVAERLRQGGAILLGKLSTHEFAFGGPSIDLPFPPAHNPWNTSRIPGGSSSGPAAAVAAGYVRFAPGSCTGGSIRGPAAWCGVVGLKPTYGRVSRRGVFPLAWTLDHCGPIAACVEDAADALQVMAGHDPLDPASASEPVPNFKAALHDGAAGMRIGVPRRFFANHPSLSEEAARAIEDAIAWLKDAGATVEDIELPELELFTACARVVMTAEMYGLHAEDLRARPGDYGALSLNRFILGATLGANDYINALRLRRILKDAVDQTLTRHDALVTVITLTTAPSFDPPPNPSAWAVQGSAFNVTGHPAMSLPVKLARDGLPLAVQVVGRAFHETSLLRVGQALEKAAGFRHRFRK